MRSSTERSRFTTWSACLRKVSGTVSRTLMPVTRSMRSLRLSRCCTLKAQITLMPAARISWMSSWRLRWREPGTLVWATSSTTATCGRRASTASRSISSTVTPRYSIRRRGTTSRPSMRAAVSARPWVSMKPEHDVHAALLEPVRLVQHAVRLAHARRGADVDLEPAALGPLDQLEEVLRPRPRHVSDDAPSGVRMHRQPRPPELAIEGQVQAQHVHRRLARGSPSARPSTSARPRAPAPRPRVPAAGARHAGHLPARASGAEVRIEAAGRRRHQLGGHRARGLRILLLQPLHLGHHAVTQLLRGRAPGSSPRRRSRRSRCRRRTAEAGSTPGG